MLSLDEKLHRAALSYGRFQKKARESKTLKDRIQLVHAETRLAMAAEELFKREQRRDARRRNKS